MKKKNSLFPQDIPIKNNASFINGGRQVGDTAAEQAAKKPVPQTLDNSAESSPVLANEAVTEITPQQAVEVPQQKDAVRALDNRILKAAPLPKEVNNTGIKGQDKKAGGKTNELLLFAAKNILPAALGGLINGTEGFVQGFQGSQQIQQQQAAAAQQEFQNVFEQRQLEQQRQLAEQRIAAQQASQQASFDQQDRRDSRQFQQQKDLLGLKASAESAPLPVSERLAGLGGEEKKRFDNVREAIQGIDAISAELSKGTNTFSLIGDNKLTFNKTLVAEAIGRMQSGGAISEKEEERFVGMLPKSTDNSEIQRAKLTNLRNNMQQRLATLGFAPEEVGLQSQEGLNERKERLVQAIAARGIK